jgi:hypothetical protein
MNTDLNEIPCDLNIGYSNSISPIDKNFLNVLYLNARSIRNKFDELTTMIYTTSQKLTKPLHAIVITENWIYDSEAMFFNIRGYKSFHCNRIGRRGGGVSIYVNDELHASVSRNFVRDDNNYLLLELPEFNLNLLGIYRSHASVFSSVTDCFESEFSSLRNVIVVGDLNINLCDFDDPDVQIYRSLTNANGLFFLNNSSYPTRVSNTIQTVIDHVATDMIDGRYWLSYLDWSLSDHKTLLLTFDRSVPPKQNNLVRTFVDYRTISDNVDLLQHVCTALDFDDFISKLSNVIVGHTSTRTILVKVNPRKKYISSEIIAMISKKEKFYRLMRRYPENLFFNNRYRTLRNIVRYRIRDAKRIYYENSLRGCLSDSRKTWGIVNELISGKDKKAASFVIDTVAGRISDDTEVANEFNNFFAGVGPTIHADIDAERHDGADFRTNLHYVDSLLSVFDQTDEREVLEIIADLKTGAAVGYDTISAKFLKKFGTVLAPKIVSLTNQCLLEGTFPDSLKIAKVTPVFKSGNKSNMSNYRPISVLSATSKIFEIIILKRLLSYLNSTDYFNRNQFGFLKSSSTLAAVIALTNYIFTNIDCGKRTGCLFIDLQKAFDSVDHTILLEKLRAAGITGVAFSLFVSYLAGRKQFVIVNGRKSRLEPIVSGIAQGSILGATLFLIFINDIFLVQLHGEIQLYADDAALMYGATDYTTILTHMRNDAQRLNKWFTMNNIKMNLSKTNFILFRNPESVLSSFQVDGNFISEIRSVRYLGLILDSHLKWEDHLNYVRKRISPMLFALRRTRMCISEEVAWQLYYAHIFSHLTYLCPIWSSASNSRLRVLRVLQNKAIKIIKMYGWRHPTLDLYSPTILPFDVVCEFNLLMTIFKIKHGMLKSNALLEEVSNLHDHNTRASANSNIYINFTRTSLGQYNIFYRGLRLFNELPRQIKNAVTISSFKKYVGLMLFERYLIRN